jgi:dihydroxyacid dehydratase/phosphogluconate dehydratase
VPIARSRRLEAAGGKPQVFGVPTITDGIGMGTEA